MPHNISASGVVALLTASKTFPRGFSITNWADDADPFDAPSKQIRDTAMNINGQMVHWNIASPQPITINVIPGSPDDANLGLLAQQNTKTRTTRSVDDEISIVFEYPNGDTATLGGGVITDGTPLTSPSAAGRNKSKQYTFAFEDVKYNFANAR